MTLSPATSREGGGDASVEWGTYTPALTGSAVNPNLGASGVASGVYVRVGSLVIATANLRFNGAGVAAGSGDYRVSLPLSAAVGNPAGICQGYGLISDESGTIRREVMPFFAVAGDDYVLMLSTQAFAFVANNSPWNWTTLDGITISVVYQTDAA